jgi:Icc-related predicted phosphoesterase
MTKNLSIYKLHHLLNSFVIATACIILGALAVIVIVSLRVQTIKVSKFLGNRAENTDFLTNTTDPNDFTFIVAGDIKDGTATFESLLSIMEPEKPAFAVILGDFASRPEPIHHKLFACEISEDNLPFPMFLVIGNRDVNPEGAFRLEDFERIYGPSQFHFTIGKHLFIFLNNPPPFDKTEEYLNFLEQVLSERAKQSEEVFVFMHVPPSGLNPSLVSRTLHGSERFYDLVEKYHVQYVFTGDHHGYVKTVKNGTTYIVTGGGGARLRGTHGRFHHLVRIGVENGMTTETVVVTKKHMEALELLERNIVVYLWPLISRNYVSVAVTLLLSVIAVWLLISSIRRCRQPG